MGPKLIGRFFTPLRVNYKWEACYAFDRLTEGHSWRFTEAGLWRRVSYEARKGDGDPFAKGDELCLAVSAARNYKKVRAAIEMEAKTKSWLSDRPSDLVKWLREPESRTNVDRGISLVLNALVRQSTLKPFEIICTFVEDQCTVEIRDLGRHVPRWFYYEIKPAIRLDEYLIIFPTLYGKERGEKWRLRTDLLDALLRLHMYCRIRHRLSVARIGQTDDTIVVTLQDEAEIVEYIRGATCRCIPVPGKCPWPKERREPEGVNSPEVVVSSPVVGEALAQLSRVWQDPCAGSVLISSPPGSGKEVFANSIPYGNGRATERLQSLSMATDDQQGLERQLYGYQRDDGSLADGLIAQASGSAVFLDEVHQPEKDKAAPARASLLRTLETGTYYPVGCVQQQSVDRVLFVMATSKTLEELAEYKPVDFWTRVTHALRIRHPFDFVPKGGTASGSMERVIADFFRFFWWDLCDRQYHINPLDDPNSLAQHQIPGYWQQCSMLRVICPFDPGDESMPESFAHLFLELLKNRDLNPPQFSVRGVRNMVARIFAIAWSNVAQGRDPWESGLESFKKDVVKVFTEIHNLARLG